MPLFELRILKIHSFPHFSLTCFDILSWNFAYDFLLPYYRSSFSVVKFVGVMPLFELRILKIHSFPHFSLTCFDILSWNFAYDFVLLYFRSSLSVVNFRHFLYARLQTGRIMVWWCPSVRVSVRPSVLPSQFSALFSYMLWDIELKFCVVLYFDARKIKFKCHKFPSIFGGVMPLLNFKFLQICSFPHFSPTCFDILSWNFVYDFVLLYYRSSPSVVYLRQFF